MTSPKPSGIGRGGPGKPRRFHFKSPPLRDPAIQRFGEWPAENRDFYGGFRAWLMENSYGASTAEKYGAALRMAVGFLQKPYWNIDPDADLVRVREHLAQSHQSPTTQAVYRKGLLKLAEYLRLRCQRPSKEKEIPWQHTMGMLSPALQNDAREFLKHCQHAWKVERRFEHSRDLLYRLSHPLRWMVEQMHLDQIEALTPQIWYAYVDQRLAAGIQPSSLNTELSELKHFVHFLHGNGRAICERFLLVETLDIGFRMPKDVPLEGLRKLQAAIQAEANLSHMGRRRLGRMDLAWFLLMLHCGLRTGEIRRLKLRDIEWEARRLRIDQSKGLKDRYVYLDETVLQAMQSYLAERGQVEALPENVFIVRHVPLSRSYCSERLGTYGRRCGVKVAAHRLRHSCATLLLNAGAPVLSVQMILGHKQVNTTLGYARLYDGTVAADYYAAMNHIERQLALPEDRVKTAPSIGELIALADALRSGSLNPAQTELVRALREGLGQLENVKVQEDVEVTKLFASAEIL
jgi:site-specific recombinase XerD